MTDRIRELLAATGDPAQAQAEAEASIPMGRFGEPEEFGKVAAFLLSPGGQLPHRHHGPGRRRRPALPLTGRERPAVTPPRPAARSRHSGS